MDCSVLSTCADDLNRPSTSKQSCYNANGGSKKTIANRDLINDADNDVIILSDDSDAVFSENEDSFFAEDSTSKMDLSLVMDTSKLQAIVKETPELQMLFKNQLMEPLTFLLILHDFSLEIRLTKLIEDCGGVVYSSVHDIDGYTAVMVKDESLHWMYLGPVFKVSYIQACIESKKVLNISMFFKRSTKLILIENFNYMNVIYFKKYSWESIPEKFLPKKLDDSTSSHQSRSSKTRCDNETITDLQKECKGCERTVRKPVVNKHTRMLYSRKEDEDIVKYIIKHEGYDNVKGNSFWKTMEERNVCPTRTWQSIKERFLKKIVYNLDSYKFLTNKQIDLLQISIVRKS